jgi:hypothetical protein
VLLNLADRAGTCLIAELLQQMGEEAYDARVGGPNQEFGPIRMIIVWRGRGILVAAIAFGFLLTTEVLTRVFFHDHTYYQQHGWPKLVGFLAAACLVWFLLPSRRSDVSSGEGFQNPRTTQSVLKERDELLHISAKYWPAILCALGIVFYFIRY